MSSEKTIEKDLTISNSKGLHARPASMLVQTAMKYSSEIIISKQDTDDKADCKSVMSLLMLAAPAGTKIRLSVKGEDADEAISAIIDLIQRGFDDD